MVAVESASGWRNCKKLNLQLAQSDANGPPSHVTSMSTASGAVHSKFTCSIEHSAHESVPNARPALCVAKTVPRRKSPPEPIMCTPTAPSMLCVFVEIS